MTRKLLTSFSESTELSNDNDEADYYEKMMYWNQECSDDRSMQRRTPIRRQRTILDDDQTKDAMKLLEKYVRKKYRHSILVGQDGMETGESANTPVGHTQSAYQYPRQLTPAERLSTVFNSTPIAQTQSEFGMPPNSPVLPPTITQQNSFRSEMKFKETESLVTYVGRTVQFLYNFLGVHYIILALVIIGYACLGGYIFMRLEEEQQIIDLEDEQEEILNDSKILAQNLLNYVKQFNCSNENDEKCLNLITKAFVERSKKVDHNIRGEGWRWDFWNSVFFAATIFTTIGYGNLACKTKTGRIVTIVYGLIGIPLMLFVLKVYGEFAIDKAQKIRLFIKRIFRKCVRSFKGDGLKRADTIETVATNDMEEYNLNCDESSEDDRFSTFPVRWALCICVLFMVFCSFFVSLWENWDFFTAFYFFFVSLSTIGFGDVIPEHPRTACGLFILYFVGLALFSMVYAILQERVENKYMWALELIDQEYHENQKVECEYDEPIEKPSIISQEKQGLGKLNSQSSVRWRSKLSSDTIDNIPDRPISERRYSVFTPGDQPPPVLGTFMLHNLSMKKKLIARSESILNKAAKRPTSLFPSNELLTTPINSSRGSPWFNNDQPKENLSKSSNGISAPNLSSGVAGNRSPSGALSVITEASDEDSRHFKKNTHRRPLCRTSGIDDSSRVSSESLDQALDELQLESNDPITPKPYQESRRTPKMRNGSGVESSTAERLPLSPNETILEDEEEEKDANVE